MQPTSLTVDLANAFTRISPDEHVTLFIPTYVEAVVYTREQFLLAAFLRHAKKTVSLFHVAAIVDMLLTKYADERRQTGTADERKDFLAAVTPRLFKLMAMRFQEEENDVFANDLNEAMHILTTLIAYLIREFPIEVSDYVADYSLKNQYSVPVLLEPKL